MHSDMHAAFLALHLGDSPLLLANAWDAASARLWQEAGARAVGTSSAAVAWSRGHADGGALPREELLSSLRDMVRVLSVPVTADIEDGYGDDPQAVAELAAEVAATGAVGINIEDGAGAPELLAAKIRAIRGRLGDAPLFINARTDVYLRDLARDAAAVAATIERLSLYREAGADGGFVPGLASTGAAKAVADAVPLAINLMAVPGLPAVAELGRAGVRRISVGPGLFRAAFSAGEAATRAALRGDFEPCLDNAMSYGALNAMFATR